jgi:hypothetical protein
MTPNRKAQIATAAAAVALVIPLASPAAASGSAAFPATIHATRINVKLANAGGALRRGSPVSGKDITQRVSLGGDVLAGLADRGALFGSSTPHSRPTMEAIGTSTARCSIERQPTHRTSPAGLPHSARTPSWRGVPAATS